MDNSISFILASSAEKDYCSEWIELNQFTSWSEIEKELKMQDKTRRKRLLRRVSFFAL